MGKKNAVVQGVGEQEIARQNHGTRMQTLTRKIRWLDRSRVSKQEQVRSQSANRRTARSVTTLLPATLGLLVLLAGCGANPKAANKENFLKAIQAYEQAEPERTRLCTRVTTGIEDASADYQPSVRQEDYYVQMAALAQLGYLTITDTTGQGLFASQKVVRVAVTPKFVQTFGKPASYIQAVCVGTSSVEHVDDFTTPAEMMGYQVSQVEATVKQTVTAAWTKDKELTNVVRYRAPTAERKQRYVMVLKDSGWAVDSLR